MFSKDNSIISINKDPLEVEHVIKELKALYELFNLPSIGVAETYRRISASLREENPSETWGWQYLHQISNRKIFPSLKIARAISKLLIKLQVFGEVELEEVVVLAPVGQVVQYSVVTQGSRQCKRCHRSFIPRVSNQVYCTTSCGKTSIKEPHG